MRHGNGLHTSSNGDIYKGYWRLDKRHGRGKVTLANGMQYEGDWVDDKAHGCVLHCLPDVLYYSTLCLRLTSPTLRRL